MNDEDSEFYRLEKEANAAFRKFKRDLKQAYPNLYRVVKKHEKEQNEKDFLMVDLFSSKFVEDVEKKIKQTEQML